MSDTILTGDFTVYYAAENGRKAIEWTGSGTGTRTLNELYSALQDLFDESAQMDDKIPMSAQTPTEYSMINQWFIDDTTVEHLTGGALVSNGWIVGGTEHVLVATVDPTVDGFEVDDIGRTLFGATTNDTGTLLDFLVAGAVGKIFIRPDVPEAGGDEFDNGSEVFTFTLEDVTDARSDDGGVFVDETADCNDSGGGGDVSPFPGATPLSVDAFYVGSGTTFPAMNIDISTSGTDSYTLDAQYWNGGSWVSVIGEVDDTTDFKAAPGFHKWRHTPQADWAAVVVDSQGPFFYVRFLHDGGAETVKPLLEEVDITGAGEGVFTVASAAGESIWSGITTLGTIQSNTHIYIVQNGAILTAIKAATDWWDDGQLDLLVKVQEAAVLIDDGEIVVLARQYSKTYSHFISDVSGGGNTPVPLSTGDDLDNTEGFRRITVNTATNNFAIDDTFVNSTDGTIQGIITALGSTSSTQTTVDYYLFGDPLTDFSTATNITASPSGSTGLVSVAPSAVGPAAGPDNTITVVHTAVTRDINNGAGFRPYSIEIDAQTLLVGTVYGRLKYLTRRGSTIALDGLQGQQYIGNDLQLEYDGQSSNFVEGGVVVGGTSSAFGTIVADHDDGATGDIILRNTRGTFTTNENVDDGTGDANIVTIRVITSPPASPLGTFAGGKFFGAPGVFLTNRNTADAQNFQLVDDDGNTQIPPNVQAVSITNLSTGDSVGIFRSTGTAIIKDQFSVGSTIAAGSTSLLMSAAIAADVSPSGKIKIVDLSAQNEQRFRYQSFSTDTFLLTNSTAMAQSSNSTGTLFTGSTADVNFDSTADAAEVGDLLRNVTDGSEALVTVVVSQAVLEHTVLVGGTNNNWSTDDAMTLNVPNASYSTEDAAYAPFVDRIADSTVSEGNTFTYSVDIPVVLRVRNAGNILPFESFQTVGSGGLSVAAIRNPDSIFST